MSDFDMNSGTVAAENGISNSPGILPDWLAAGAPVVTSLGPSANISHAAPVSLADELRFLPDADMRFEKDGNCVSFRQTPGKRTGTLFVVGAEGKQLRLFVDFDCTDNFPNSKGTMLTTRVKVGAPLSSLIIEALDPFVYASIAAHVSLEPPELKPTELPLL